METWNQYAALLAALDDAVHGRNESGQTFTEVLAAFARLVEADAGARLCREDASPAPATPLSDPGIRKLLAGLVDLAGSVTADGAEYRELGALLQSFESAPADSPQAGPDPAS